MLNKCSGANIFVFIINVAHFDRPEVAVIGVSDSIVRVVKAGDGPLCDLVEKELAILVRRRNPTWETLHTRLSCV